MGRVFIMSDIHGQGKAFDRMMQYINFSAADKLYVLGDIIDRGPDGYRLLKYAGETENIFFLKGNHEDMMYHALTEGGYYRSLWFHNGGDTTAAHIEDDTEAISLVESLPYCFDIGVNEKKFLLVHAGLSFPAFAGKNFKPENCIQHSIMRGDIIWGRDEWLLKEARARFFPEHMVVYGHTPKRPPCVFERGCMNIDTGAGSNKFLICYNATENLIYTYDISADEFLEPYVPKEL